ncbi:MAG: hypothetical protein IKY70_02475 [Bacteroidales bacterium]|nr:hypothetical protein [Bacteroidales bacterium]
MRKFFAILLILFLSFSFADAQLKHNVKTPSDPVAMELPESEKGVVLDTLMQDSKIYPGTRRRVQVYVPVQYDASKPACLVVGLDGNLFNAITVIGNLIKSGEMPVAIGVFVEPGVIYAPDGSVVRYNRSNEFDRTNGEFASFLESEVLPMVESMTLPDGKPILISKDPNDRAITGASSSGIAAFTVAWERPDLFSRVYSSVGTFVAMRGGNEYPAIIRKSEPKPLRIFLQDGVNDTWNHIFGDWWEYNQLMSSALNFAGYEFDFKWDRGTHSIYYGTRAYPDAMRWLWRGWPAAVERGKSMNGMLESLLVDGEEWQPVECIPAELVQLESGIDNAKIYGKQIKGDIANICCLNGGSAYISDLNGNLWYACNSKKPVKLNTLENGASQFAIYPNHRMLITSEKNSNWLISYVIREDGTLEAGQRFYWLHDIYNHTQQPVGNMVFDTHGNLYVATAMGIQVCDQNGRVRAILAPAGKSNVEKVYLSGNRLFALAGGKWYVLNVEHTGYEPSQGPIDVKSQGQG